MAGRHPGSLSILSRGSRMAWFAEAYAFVQANSWWLIALIPVVIVVFFVKISR
jgi:hypothetical protein